MEVRGPDLVVFFGDGVAAPADAAGNPQAGQALSRNHLTMAIERIDHGESGVVVRRWRASGLFVWWAIVDELGTARCA